MNPGEQVILNMETKQIVLKEVETHLFTSWTNNKLIFVNMRLEELKVLLERKYGVEIDHIPDDGDFEDWLSEGLAEALDGCIVEPDGHCKHGCPSWLLALGWI